MWGEFAYQVGIFLNSSLKDLVGPSPYSMFKATWTIKDSFNGGTIALWGDMREKS